VAPESNPKFPAFSLNRMYNCNLTGSPDPSHFIFVINVGKRRIRHRTALNLNDIRFQFQSRCMSDPLLSDIDFKNKMAWVWTTLKLLFYSKLVKCGSFECNVLYPNTLDKEKVLGKTFLDNIPIVILNWYYMINPYLILYI